MRAHKGSRRARVTLHTALLVAACAFAGCSIVVDHQLDDLPARGGAGGGGGGGMMTPDGGSDGGVEPCRLAVCECATDADCGAHAFCDMTGAENQCRCATGYLVPDGASSCAWGVHPNDPALRDADAWTVVGSAVVNENDPGGVDPGAASFDSDAICNYSELHQTLDMPPYELAEPLVMEVHYSVSTGEDPNLWPTLVVGLSGHLREIPLGATTPGGPIDPHPLRYCLPEIAYGGEVDLLLGASPPNGYCTGQNVKLDHVEIEPADPGECPPVGSVRDGAFESAGWWSLYTTGTDAIAEILDSGDDRSLHFSLAKLCSSAKATGVAVWPTATATFAPALELTWNGMADDPLVVGDGYRNFGALEGTGTKVVSHVCVPPWLHGTTTPLRFMTSTAGGGCSIDYAREVIIDDVSVVDEPACGHDPYLLDGNFELATNAAIPSVWVVTANAGMASGNVLVAEGAARTGDGSMHLMITNNCGNAHATNRAVLPPASEAGGPAVRFFYRTANLGSGTVRGPLDMSLAAAATWTEAITCLPLGRPGRSIDIEFSIQGPGSGCATEITPAELYVDDVTIVGADPSCPAL
jgi:hypothetical protein